MPFGKPSPATVIASLALFVALGGSAYAVSALPRNSVGTQQLRPRAVKERDLGNRAVITRKLADRAVTEAKLARGAVTADRVAPDALGGAQIDEATLAPVPAAGEASHARTADRATFAGSVDRAARADRADSAGTADRATVADRATEAARADVAGALRTVDVAEYAYELDDGGGSFLTAPCSEGLVPVSGGFDFDPELDLPYLAESSPGVDGWRLALLDGQPGNGVGVQGSIYAICIPTGQS